ncbi:unnamed protein product [Hydatigera taeniaeformis]|uniref:Cytoplasmic dynein 2 heavy chain 1 n=1 Tax=Hydatigena taeniaeformis TaxID=6205 RepID=A0A0R3WNY3_HYDTA|nr:unnamed protein product [Hydatigera taeniaeformis]
MGLAIDIPDVNGNTVGVETFDLSTRISDFSVTSALTKNSYMIANENSEAEINKAWNKLKMSALAAQHHVNSAAEYHKDKLGEIKVNLAKLDRLCIISKSISPLERVFQSPESVEEFEGVILCDFSDELNKICLRRGQPVKVLQTGQSTLSASTAAKDEPPPLKSYWIIQSTTQANPIKIPFVYVGLGKADPDSLNRALCITEEFLDSWSDKIDKWLATGVLHFTSLLDEMERNKNLCIEDSDKALRLLAELELSFPQKEGAITNNQLRAKIALIRAKLRNQEKCTTLFSFQYND